MWDAARETERGRVTDTRGETTTTTGAGKISRRTIKIASVTVNSARDSPVWADSGDSVEGKVQLPQTSAWEWEAGS